MVMRVLKPVLAKISRGYQDDYAEMLKVFEYSDPSTVSHVLFRHGKSNSESLKTDFPKIDHRKTGIKRD